MNWCWSTDLNIIKDIVIKLKWLWKDIIENLLIEDQYVNKYINKEALENLKDVNLTYEYFGDNRKIIVSKKFYKLIKQKDTKALFLPIYSK